MIDRLREALKDYDSSVKATGRHIPDNATIMDARDVLGAARGATGRSLESYNEFFVQHCAEVVRWRESAILSGRV